MHRFLSLPNKAGLSDLFRGKLELHTVKQMIEGNSNIEVITSGDLPPNPAELLGSNRMEGILDYMRSSTDMIIIDTPPSLVSDATILSAKVDGVILVIQSGKTNIAHARAALEQLNQVDARVVGVVLNRIPRNRADYYGGYKKYSNYYKGESYHIEEKEA